MIGIGLASGFRWICAVGVDMDGKGADLLKALLAN